jgi:hypothetical protein
MTGTTAITLVVTLTFNTHMQVQRCIGSAAKNLLVMPRSLMGCLISHKRQQKSNQKLLHVDIPTKDSSELVSFNL